MLAKAAVCSSAERRGDWGLAAAAESGARLRLAEGLLRPDARGKLGPAREGVGVFWECEFGALSLLAFFADFADGVDFGDGKADWSETYRLYSCALFILLEK